MSRSRRNCIFLTLIIILASLAVACGKNVETPTAVQPTLPPTITLTNVPPSETPTPVPLAAVVNGQGISLAEFQGELARYQASISKGTATPVPGGNPSADARQRVLDELIDNLLLAQGAVQEGYKVDQAAVQARFDQLSAQAGGAQAVATWEASQGYTEASFRLALQNAMAAAWMRDRIAAGVPQAVEQVHARQILAYSETEANQLLSQIDSGVDFVTLAEDYDPVGGGDLGWFPQGYLTEPELEKAAFSLKPGEHSGVIHTSLGYHILEVIERDPQRVLDPEARLVLQTQAVEKWLAQRRSQSQIKIITP